MSESTEKRYLKWYNKIGYGSGDIEIGRAHV